MPMDPVLLAVSRWLVVDLLDVHFGLNMWAAPGCNRARSYKLPRHSNRFIVTRVSMLSKLSTDCTASSSAWYTYVKKGPKALTA